MTPRRSMPFCATSPHDLINDDDKLLESSFVVPTEVLGDVAATVRAPGSPLRR
jgi:hypothetical protein